MSKKYDTYAWFYGSDDLNALKEYFTQLTVRGPKRERGISREKSMEKDIDSRYYYFKLKKSALLNLDHKDDVRTMYRNYLYPELNVKENVKLLGIAEEILKTFGIVKEFWQPTNLPIYSALIQIKFKLKKPYISKDDDEFYIIDNPIVKDKVSKLPMVRPTTWKGALRFAAIKVFENWVYEKLSKSKLDRETVFKERAKIVKLFGNEKDSQEEYLGKQCLLAIEGELPAGKKLKEEVEKINKEFETWLIDEKIISKGIPSRSGRLFFYPTFFEEISLDVITPLSRETRTPVKGRSPIYFEIVPENAEGTFRLLYYPFDLIAEGKLDEIEREMENDLEYLKEALKKMFYEIGFSAKKSSGFGVVKQIGENDVTVTGFKSEEIRETAISKLCTKVNRTVNDGASK